MSRLIDMDTLIVKYGDWYIEEGTEEGYIGSLETLLSDEPTIDAEPVRRGRWVEEHDRDNHWHCSECGFTEGIISKFYRFCPNCGAKMDGGEDNADK